MPLHVMGSLTSPTAARKVREAISTHGQPVAEASIVALRKVTAEMNAPGFLTLEHRSEHQSGEREEVLQLPALRRGHFVRQHVLAPEAEVFQSLLEPRAGPHAARPPAREALQRVPQVSEVQLGAVGLERRVNRQRPQLLLFLLQLGDGSIGAPCSIDETLEEAVGGEPIRAMEAAAGHFP